MVIILIKKNIKNDKTKNLLSNQKGMALLTTLIFVFILVTFGVALLTMTSNDIKLSALQRDSTEAFYVAEAGIDKALWYLNTPEDNGGEGLEWRPNEEKESYPAGSTNYYKLTVEDTAEQDIIKITSRGVVSDGNKVYGSRKIEVEAKKAISPSPSLLVYNYAIATEGDLTFRGDIEIDGDVHSNGDISLVSGDTEITGEATASGVLNQLGSANYATQMYPKIDFEYYKVLAINNGSYYETGVVFNDSTELNGIYFIEGNVEIMQNADLNIINGGAIFATGTITVTAKPTINRTQTAGYDNPLAIIAKGDISLGGYVDVEGVIQTEGELTLDVTTVNEYIKVDRGTVIADEGISISFIGGRSGIDISYNPNDPNDPNLLGENIIGTGIEIYKIISWQEID